MIYRAARLAKGWFGYAHREVVLRSIASFLLLLLAGLAIATVWAWRNYQEPLEVVGSSGSYGAPESPIGPGPATEFVNLTADARPFIRMRFDAPYALARIVHSYAGDAAPASRITRAAVQVSDNGTDWKDAAQAEGRNGVLMFDVEKAGGHKFWKMTALESGDPRSVVFGKVQYVPRYELLRRVPVDLIWLSLIPALLLLFSLSPSGLSPNYLFASFAIPVTLFVFMYSFGYVPYHTLYFNDSPTYLQKVLTGTYASNRNSGYSTILVAINRTIGIDHIAWFQFGAVITCYLFGAWLLGSYLKQKWLAPFVVGMFLAQGATSAFSDQILTEALFTAGLGLFAASLGTLAWQPRAGAVIAGLVGIVLATLAKSIGIVLIIPALLIARFLPKGVRFRGSVPIAAVGLATYVAMAGYNYSRNGAFAPENFAGVALVGHVAWMLDDSSMPRSDLTRQMLTAAAEVVRKRPESLTKVDSFEALDRYVDYTAVEFDELLWRGLYTVGAPHFGSGAVENAFYLRLAISSIRAHPAPYVLHSAAHFYGLWRDLGNVQPLREAAIDIRAQPLHETVSERQLRDSNPPSVLARYPERAQLEAELGRQASLPLAFRGLWNYHWINSASTIALGVMSLVLCTLYFIPSALARFYRTEIMIALGLNAYFAAHALFHATQPRYANVGILAAFFLVASFILRTMSHFKGLFGRSKESSRA